MSSSLKFRPPFSFNFLVDEIGEFIYSILTILISPINTKAQKPKKKKERKNKLIFKSQKKTNYLFIAKIKNSNFFITYSLNYSNFKFTNNF